MLRTGKVPLRTVWSMATCLHQEQGTSSPSCWEYWLLMAHIWVLFCISLSAIALPRGISPLRNGQKRYKNTPPCLYSGWHWMETPDPEPLWGLPVASTAMCSQINFSLCFHLSSTDVVPSNYAHKSPIGVSFPGNSI